jgi:NAD(P)-dependent dehydrogenase (short-subunit alcohol dehydrogenase family)
MFTFDLAERLRGRSVTVNCLHPGTFMPTKMVDAMGVTPVDSLDTGIRSTLRLITAPELDGVTGVYFDRFEASRADGQAYEDDARSRLWALSEQLIAPFVDGT